MVMRSIRIGSVAVLVLLLVATAPGQMRSGKLGVGFSGTGCLLQSDYSKSNMKYGGGLSLSYSVTQYLGLRSTFLFDQMQFTNGNTGEQFNVNVFSGNMYLSLDMMPNSSINPFVVAGAGRAYYNGKGIDGTTQLPGAGFDLHLLAGGGFDIFLSEFLSMTIMGEYVMTGSDTYDGLKNGNANDNYARVSIQFRYYFFDQDFVTKLLEAMKHRYEGH